MDGRFERCSNRTRYVPCPVIPDPLNFIDAFTPTDLKNDKSNWNKTPGYTKSETDAFARILNGTTEDDSEDVNASTSAAASKYPKFVDVWRQLHPTDEHYTYFSYRFNCRSKGLGWRLDMCMCCSFHDSHSVWCTDLNDIALSYANLNVGSRTQRAAR